MNDEARPARDRLVGRAGQALLGSGTAPLEPRWRFGLRDELPLTLPSREILSALCMCVGGCWQCGEMTAVGAEGGDARVGVSVGAVLADAAAPSEIYEDIPAAARYAESVGLDSLWAGDHLTMGPVPLLDCTLVLAAAAAATDRVLLGTAVFVPSLRPLAWAAKQVATLSVLSGERRLQLGVAAGAGLEDDHRAAGFARADRARRTDAFPLALPYLPAGRTTDLPGPDGPVAAQLAPAVRPPVIWVGGASVKAMRRAVRFGDGWLASLLTADEFAAAVQKLNELADRAGRPRLELGVVTHAAIDNVRNSVVRTTAASVLQSAYGLTQERADQLAIAGSPENVADQLHA